ncbi:MAG: hypothetical protein LBN10_11740 [Propionibacteriaceae bacterium]|jgi:hypothetical protein|nr:hypothetical protein [Propionibacteriaceae bacterium]
MDDRRKPDDLEGRLADRAEEAIRAAEWLQRELDEALGRIGALEAELRAARSKSGQE